MSWNVLARQLQQQVTGRVLAGASMKQFTTWRIGGPADLLLIPGAEADVAAAVDFAARHGLPLSVVGNGSNLLVSDSGIRGLTLRIGGGLTGLEVDDGEILAEAGVFLPALSKRAMQEGLGGLEFAGGIPASLGGALIMNAGAFGQRIGEIVSTVETVDFNGVKKEWAASELFFDYRWSALQSQRLVILRARMRLQPGDSREIRERYDYFLEYRSNHHPLDQPSAGSVFRNPPGTAAGRLIEMAGLKGFRVGDAQISTKHANFIVNLGNATAAQVKELMQITTDRVSALFGIELETEVRMVGEHARS
jgi:UDP-N-acetylmuramate dehydrogenase